jgi:hypothetical protein
MRELRGVLALSLCVPVCAYNVPLYAGGKPLGGGVCRAPERFGRICWLDGEHLSTDPNGKIGVRVGTSVIALV